MSSKGEQDNETFILDLKEIGTEAEAEMAAEILIDSIVKDNVLKKGIGKDFLNKCLRNLEDENSSPELKFNTLCIFRFFHSNEKTVLKIFSLLSGHPLFTFLVDTAAKVDPRKSIDDKGKKLFAKDSELGTRFMRLLLESLKIWSERFPQNSSKEPTKYKKAVTRLTDDRVTFPTEYTFYSSDTKKTKSSKNPVGNEEDSPPQPKRESKREEPTKQTPDLSAPLDKKSIASEIRYLDNKIEMFIGLIEDEEQDDIDAFEKSITENHEAFKKDLVKFSQMNPYDTESEETIELFLKLNDFLSIESEVYETQIIKNDDLKTYCDLILLEYDKIFDEGTKRESTEMKQKKSPSAINKDKDNGKKPLNPKEESKELKESKLNKEPSSSSVVVDKKELAREGVVSALEKIIKPDKNAAEKSYKSTVNRKSSGGPVESEKSLSVFFDKILDKSKRSQSGFKALRESLEKEKKEQLKANPPRGKSPHSSGMGTGHSKFNASTVSKIGGGTNGIFSRPPNPSVGPKKFDGELVYENAELAEILYDLKKDQGLKRFKISHLKSRSLLFENEHIQIGCKTEPLYEECPEYDEIIELELFMGNKSSSYMTDLEVKFHGDQSTFFIDITTCLESLIYSNPQKVQSNVEAGEQVKFEVIIIPRSVFFNLTNMRISYSINRVPVHTSCILPASLLKFTQYFKIDKREFKNEEVTALKTLQSEPFKLCHYFPPRKIAHYIEELVELTDYSDFAEANSITDFELGGSVLIKNKFQALLKIIVRPDLNVVLQIKSGEASEDSIKQFRLYIQTLLLVLKESR